MKKVLISTLFLAASGLATASTAFTDAAEAVNYRQASFQLIRHNMLDIRDMVQGNIAWDDARIKRRADALALVSTLPWEAFQVAGTEQGGGDAKAAVWQNMADFTERGEKLAADAAALKAAADSGEQAAIRRAFGNYARNCKACHDNYKN